MTLTGADKYTEWTTEKEASYRVLILRKKSSQAAQHRGQN
jgi:hypothetical protein